MEFAGKVWKLLVAIKDGLALLFLLLFFLLLYAALTARPSAASLREGALLLKLDGTIVEEPAGISPLNLILASEVPMREYGVHEVVRGLRVAARDDRIKAVVLDLSRFAGGGQVHLQDVGKALDGVRGAGKPVFAFAQLYTDDGIQLAAHASEIWVEPFGGAIPSGPGGTSLYVGALLERLKITPHVFRVGTYKSAVEPLTQEGMSPEARQNRAAIYAASWNAWQAEVKKARPKANIALATEDPAAWLRASGGDFARAALAAGLVDRIGDAAQFGERVAQVAGKGTASKRPGSFAHTPLDSWLAANPPSRRGKAIGVITIAGNITVGNAGPGTAGSGRIVRLLDESLNEELAALVVRVDSPGGAVIAGEQIRGALERYRARNIPVVVSMGNVAASGGYWVATPAERIFAEPATLTGSIGVFAILPSFERALADWGVRSDGLRTTPLSGQPDPFAGYSPAFSDVLQANVEFTYGRFLELVGQARGRTPQQVDAVAQGRVWDGGAARENGLIDQFGGLDDALAYAASAAKLPEGGWHARFLGRDQRALTTLLGSFLSSGDGTVSGVPRDWVGLATERQTAALHRAIADLERFGGAQGVQAYCLDCPSLPTAQAAEPRQGSALGLIARVLAVRTP